LGFNILVQENLPQTSGIKNKSYFYFLIPVEFSLSFSFLKSTIDLGKRKENYCFVALLF
jgi:hypothetical protein